MSKIDLVRQFVNTITKCNCIIAKERDDWGMNIDERQPRLTLPHDLRQNTQEDKEFRQFITSKCSITKGFSNVTISLLHEIGHWETRDEVDWEKYYTDRADVYGFDYFNLEAELKATEWAITWLQDSQNRAYAKSFERMFFGY